ncbi:hypothetical protein NWP22_02785 [Anabaenopsis tanganyikae CS-531]|uniref:Uncharacterized protein n=1 Tax=Anabaenopsis tanganyikae CS-531 TaxID=2785304 RepID=A0ABT6KAF6_9CYAN|nr:hypothetical protein [Anabaenopsis tanganyikae]MDH6104809.1 hypothetical protein [Anabaenopsis tanganyikae CS-531]
MCFHLAIATHRCKLCVAIACASCVSPITDLKANNYNLDIKNPHQVDVAQADLDEMLAEYHKLMAELGDVRGKLKFELMSALNDQVDQTIE